METAIIRTDGERQSLILSPDDIQTLVTAGVIPSGTPEPQIRLFARFCSESRLSPFKRQVHLIKRRSKEREVFNIQTGIDGYRAIADRTGRYAGNDDYLFDNGLTEYEVVKGNRTQPITATSTVYKMIAGTRCPFSATARWEEYYPGDRQAFMWDKMPFLMLGKCAEALALRKAFPDELGGIYTDEEMQQSGVVVETHRPALAESVDESTGEITGTNGGSKPTTTVEGATFKGFDPSQELVGWGKHRDQTWLQVADEDPGYLNWVIKDGKDDSKKKAVATKKYVEMRDTKNPPVPVASELAEQFDNPVTGKSMKTKAEISKLITSDRTAEGLRLLTKRVQKESTEGNLTESDSMDLLEAIDEQGRKAGLVK